MGRSLLSLDGWMSGSFVSIYQGRTRSCSGVLSLSVPPGSIFFTFLFVGRLGFGPQGSSLLYLSTKAEEAGRPESYS